MATGLVEAGVALLLGVQLIAALYCCVFGLYCFFMVWVHVRNKRAMRARDEAVWTAWRPPETELPTVTVQLPLYNEQYVVGRLIESIVHLDYPRDRLEIQILDDSTDDTTRIARDLAERWRREGFDIEVHHRTDRTGYKAGALKEGNRIARGEFVALFDADFVPAPDFLRKTLPFFGDSRVAAVQTLWGHLNEEYSQITRAQAVVLDGLNYVIQSAQNWSGAMMHFQGTAGVWRRTAIDDAGGWQADTLTEDLDLSYRAQIRGWKLKFLPWVRCAGELPPTVSAAKTQQHRWVKGGFQTAAKLMGAILRSDLTLYAKLEALYYMLALALQPFVLILAVSWPVQIVLRRDVALFEAVLPVFLLLYVCSFGPTLLFLYAQRDLYPRWWRRLHHFVYVMVWGLGIAVTNSRAILEVFLGIRTGFVRTPKFRLERTGDSFLGKAYGATFGRQVWAEALIAAWCLFGLATMLLRPKPVLDPFLLVFTLGICLVTGASVWEPIAQRRATRRGSAASRDLSREPG
jgi:cellulose synthase/poly-beta-1,6-N-acetylglucosamine synthase-like glycosyltransferase